MARVEELLSLNVWNAQVIYADIQPKRVLRPSKATVRLKTAPGEQLQHDWGAVWTEVAGERCPMHVAVNTLGYSRRFHAFAAPCEDAEHTYESLVRAFEWFEGGAGHGVGG